MKTKNVIWFYPIIVIGFILYLTNGCKKEGVPVITTTNVSNITMTTATCGGSMTVDEGSTVIACGVCWSTGMTPSITDNKTSDVDNMFSGVFSSNIIGLNPSTKYFIRAYATNNAGTVYGEAKSFTTLADQEKLEIQNYRNDNPTLSFQLKPSGLYYLDLIIGTGPVPVAHDTAYVQYTGKFLNGNVFDTNIGGADLVFPVVEGWLISGFDEGITYMREGGKAVFLMPSKLAYGSAGYYSIPGYTPLLFEVNLVKVKKR